MAENETPPPVPPDEVAPPNAELAERIEGTTAAAPAQQDKWLSLINAQREQMALALTGSGIAVERFARVALTAIRTNPTLAQATVPSLLGSIMICAQLGLEPGGPLGHAYLVPFKEKGLLQVQLILGYKGMVQLALRSGMVTSISAEVVHEGDDFAYEKGSNEYLRHVPGSTGPITHAWALAKLVTGGTPFEALTFDRVEALRHRSQNPDGKYSPWTTDYEAMVRKTAVRQLFKWLPASTEVRGALGVDSGIVRGIPSSMDDLDDVIDVTDPEGWVEDTDG